MSDNFDIRCHLDWTEDRPNLILSFPEDMDTKLIMELSIIIEKTTMKWINCKSCEQDECEKKLN